MDILGGIAGCLLGAAIALVAHISGEQGTLEIGLAVAIASLIYLLFRNRIANSADPSLPENKSLTLILNIIFFSTFAAGIYLMHSSPYRPPLYFLLISLSVVAVAAEILSSHDNKTRTGLLLLKIILISFSLRYGLLYELPGFYGVDPWWHSMIWEAWLDKGHIMAQVPGLTDHTSYINFPIMHLDVIATRLITSLEPKDSLFISIGLFYIVSPLFVFLLGQRLINTKTGLLAALFISFNSFHIAWGAWLIPTSLGIALFAIILWIIFRGTFLLSINSILIFISAILILTHTVSAFVAAIVLILLLGVNQVFGRLHEDRGREINISFALVAFFWVGMLARWIYSSRFLFDSFLGWFVDSLRIDVQYTGAAFESSAEAGVLLGGVLNRTGFLMLIVFVVIGSLLWLSRKEINSRKVAIIVGALGLAIICFGFPYFNIWTMIPGRWLPFICVIVAPVVAEGILVLSRLVNGSVRKSSLLILVVFVFSMFMVNSHGVNAHTPFYGKDYMQDPERFAFTQSEMCAVDTNSGTYDGIITADREYSKLPFETRVGVERVRYLSTKAENEGLIVIREYIYTHQFAIEECSEEQSSHLLKSFGSSKYDMVYNNGEVRAYL